MFKRMAMTTRFTMRAHVLSKEQFKQFYSLVPSRNEADENTREQPNNEHATRPVNVRSRSVDGFVYDDFVGEWGDYNTNCSAEELGYISGSAHDCVMKKVSFSSTNSRIMFEPSDEIRPSKDAFHGSDSKLSSLAKTEGRTQTSFLTYPELESSERELRKSDVSLMSSISSLPEGREDWTDLIAFSPNMVDSCKAAGNAVGTAMDYFNPTGQVVTSELSSSACDLNNNC